MMIRRSQESKNKEREFLQEIEIFEKGGLEALKEHTANVAARIYRPGDMIYKTEADMAEGFFKIARKEIGV